MLITVIVVVIVATAAFFAGMKYQQSQTSNAVGGQFAQGGSRFGQGGQMGTRRAGGFGGATVGQVVSIDASSITLKLQDGSSKIVDLTSSTTYSKTDTATASDIKTNDRIAAIGTTNSDGSITAQNIQLNPMFRNGPGGANPSGQVSPTQ